MVQGFLALDTALVHPLHLNSSFAGTFAGVAAEHRAHLKSVESEEVCRAAGWGFLPVVAETTGAWSKSSFAFIKRWSQGVSMSTGLAASESFLCLSRRLSFIVARAVARHLLRGFGPSEPDVFQAKENSG